MVTEESRGPSSDPTSTTYRVVRAVLRPLLLTVTRHQWLGQEHVPRRGGCLLAVNHLSYVDPLTLAQFVDDCGRRPRFLAKAEVFRVPVLGAVARGTGQIPVARDTADAVAAVHAAIAAVAAGECVVIYPEGTLTRDPDGWPMRAKTGAARISLRTGCPVVPIAQWGPQHILAPSRRVPRLLPRRVIGVRAGPPVPLDDLRRQPETKEILDAAGQRIMTAIVELLEELRCETAPGGHPHRTKGHVSEAAE